MTEHLRVRGRSVSSSTIEEIVRRHPAVVDVHLHIYARPNASEVAVELITDAAIASEGDRARVAAEVSEDLKRSLGIRLQCDVVGARVSADRDEHQPSAGG